MHTGFVAGLVRSARTAQFVFIPGIQLVFAELLTNANDSTIVVSPFTSTPLSQESRDSWYTPPMLEKFTSLWIYELGNIGLEKTAALDQVFDFRAQAQKTLDTALETIRGVFPVQGRGREMRLLKLWVGPTPPEDDYAGMKRTFHQGKTWEYPVFAALELIDTKTGKVIDSVDQIKLMGVPRFTPLYGYLVEGKWRYVQNQLRLKSGAYSVVTNDGGFQTQVMTAKGFNFTLNLDPQKNIFTISPSGSSSNFKLLPILLDLGIPEQKIRNTWGPDVFSANSTGTFSALATEIVRFHRGLFSSAGIDRAKAIEEIKNYLSTRTAIDPGTTERSLGTAFSIVTPELFLAATKKLLSMARGESGPDDRNSLANKELHSVETFLREYIEKSRDKVKLQVLRQIDKRDSIKEAISSTYFSKPVQSFFSNSALSNVIKQTNPVQMMNEQYKVNLLGEGGITTERAVTEELRNLHPSQAGLIDPLHTPESSAIGTTLAVTMGAGRKGNELAQALVNVKTGKIEEMTAREAMSYWVALPGQFTRVGNRWEPKTPEVKALVEGKERSVPASSVHFFIPDARGLFTVSSNLIPFINTNAGPRAMMGSKHVEQALPLTAREEPLVQSLAAGQLSFEKLLGSESATLSKVNGTVTKVDGTGVTVRDSSGNLHHHGTFDHFPLNEKTYLHSDPVVKVGASVKAGDPLADSNFTQGGALALGRNARVAYLPHKSGNSFEDGIVISDKAAQMFASPHMYKIPIDGGDDVILNKTRFSAKFPQAFRAEQLGKLDANGVVRPGQVLRQGDPVAVRLVQEVVGPEDKILMRLRRSALEPYKNRSVLWEEDHEGTVVEVVPQGTDFMVVVKTEEPARVGDKLSLRYGAKGIITKIVPDAEMPHTRDGEHMEVLLSPQGVMSRMNVGQTLENLAAKVARKTGQTILVDNFSDGDQARKVWDLARENKVSDKDDLIDPETGDTIPQVANGFNYVYKLNHPVKSKFSVRSLGPYQEDMTPTRGDQQGGQSMDMLTTYGLLAHGAKSILKESAVLKSQANPEWWRAYRMGMPTPKLRPTEAFNRFTSMLQGAGINVEKRGSSMLLMPFLDKEVGTFSNGEVKKPAQVLGKNLAPEKYGLFDERITGGLQGEKWSHFVLAEPIPHPVFEEPIKVLTGLKQAQYDQLVAGKAYVDPKTSAIVTTPTSLTGGAAIQHLLKKVDVDARLQALKDKTPNLKAAELDKVNKEVRYLNALKQTGRSPEEYVITKVPILPPKLRPVYPDEAGAMRHSDLNYLYRDMMLVNSSLKGIQNLPDTEKVRQREGLYDAMKALAGLGQSAVIQGKERKGLLTTVTGTPQPKFGYFQNKILKRRQDLSGRATIVVAPDMGIDQVGIPEEMAWGLFQERGLRELIARGLTPLRAMDAWKEKAPQARDVLLVVMKDNPVLLNRAPSLHKFSITGFEPVLRKGKAIGLHPLVVKGFNADFDGDTMAVHVPVLPKSIEEAKRMMPSQNLFNPRDNQLMVMPAHEAVQGLFMMTRIAPGARPTGSYSSEDEVREALKSKKLKASDPIHFRGKTITPGRILINDILPPAHRDLERVWDKKAMTAVLEKLATENLSQFAAVVNQLKDIGNRYSYLLGATLGISDIILPQKSRDALLNAAEKQARKISKLPGLTSDEKDTRKTQIFQQANAKIMEDQKRLFSTMDNQLGIALQSGSRATMDQVKQISSAPVMFDSATGKPVPSLIKNNLAEGLSAPDYWISLYGARKSMIDKVVSTSKPGELTKSVMSAMGKFIITEKDCGTKRGVPINLTNARSGSQAVNHMLASPAGSLARSTLLTQRHVSSLKQEGVREISIRTPLICESANGLCSFCYGLQVEKGRLAMIGENVGAIAATSIGEPSTQAVMKSFHTAGVSGAKAGITSQFERLDQLFSVPKNLPASATLSTTAGTVEVVEKAPAGGYKIQIAGKTHYVKPGQEPTVRVGQTVQKADQVSTGLVNPHDLMKLKGAEDTRQFLSQELFNTYVDGGTGMRKVHTDIAARAMTNYAKVTDPGDDPDFVPGDVAAVSRLSTFESRAAPLELPTEKASGRALSQPYGTYPAGKVLGASEIAGLKAQGVLRVRVQPKGPTFTSLLTSTTQAPLRSQDWLSRLGTTDLKKTLQEGAARYWRTHTNGVDPIPAYAVGDEFGDDPYGLY